MNRIRKFLIVTSLIISLIASSFFLSACGSKSGGSKEPKNKYYEIVTPFYLNSDGSTINIEIKNISDGVIVAQIFGTNPNGYYVEHVQYDVYGFESRWSRIEAGQIHILTARTNGFFSDISKFNIKIQVEPVRGTTSNNGKDIDDIIVLAYERAYAFNTKRFYGE